MTIDYLAAVRADAAALAAAARKGPLDAAVPSCPGWDLTRLVGHVGRVHRWVTEVARTRSEVDGSSLGRPPRDESVMDWFEAGIEPLLAALSALDPAAPAWNFTRAPQVGAFWPRRMGCETLMHRWDAEQSVGTPSPLDPALSADTIDELFDAMAPTQLAEVADLDIGGSLHVHCSDTAGEWTVTTASGALEVARTHGKGDAALRGPAEGVVLVLYRRLQPGDGGTEVFGDRAVLDRWLALPTM